MKLHKIKSLSRKINNYLEQPLISDKRMQKISNYLNSPVISKKSTTAIKDKIKNHLIPVSSSTEEVPKAGGLLVKEKIRYTVLEIQPSKLTSNEKVKWLLAEISRMYKPLIDRATICWDGVTYYPDLVAWWEVYLHKEQIKFYFIVPDRNNIKNIITKQIMKTWKQCNVKEVTDYMPILNPNTTNITNLMLKNNSVLSLDVTNPTYTPLDSILNAKYYLKDDDLAILQIGLEPVGNGWNVEAKSIYEEIKETGVIPRKKGKSVSPSEVAFTIGMGVGLVAEELMNLLGDFVIPGWEDNRELSESLKTRYGELNSTSTLAKLRSEAFKTTIRVISSSIDRERRNSIIRAISCGFDPLMGDNSLIEKSLNSKQVTSCIPRVQERKPNFRTPDIMCSIELAKLIQVPDQKAQIEHYNALNIITTRSESEVPKSIFIDDKKGIPFVIYEDTDGTKKTCYFEGKDTDRLCMARVVIGEPGTGKTTFATNFSVDAFNRGYGGMVIDAADGDMIKNILNVISPDQKHRVKIIDFLNTDFPIGLGWNEAFLGRNTDIIEDALVEEIITYITLVSGTDLNMRAKQWVENAVKAVYTTPDATLQDVENMLNNSKYRAEVIQTIEDPQLKSRWLYYHNKLSPSDRRTIYEEAFRRIAPVMDKKGIRTFILQRPKKDKEGNYILNLRKWMDEGYLVLIKCTEILGEELQTALISFLMAKYNLAIISREDIEEDKRKPCFLVLDEPDHYIKGSERWRRMLTRYRKYRCGLLLMFHGWQQLVEADKNLPKIIRKASPHYIIYHTDLDNLVELKSILEPEYKITDLAKGMPQHHAVIKLNMFNTKGEPLPPFMAKGLPPVNKRYKLYNNSDLYTSCSNELGRPKKEVMYDIFKNSTDTEFDIVDINSSTISTGEGDLDIKTIKINEVDEDEMSEEDKLEKDRKAKLIIETEMEAYIREQELKGEDVDLELIAHMDELLEEG